MFIESTTMFWKRLIFVCVTVGSVFGITFHPENRENKKSYLKLKIEDGYLQGTVQKLQNSNETVFAFRGIPYAKPPLEDLRFEPPVKNDKWEGVLNATNDKPQCVQSAVPVLGSEDCLYINVYTPKLEGNLPVLVWIYGGAFIRGNSSYDLYRPDPLLQGGDVIVVSFNYRVGVFGFISTGDTVAPGNTGLKDQCFALKWVQRNIEYFGGDPKKVTIFGESAGAASVSYQLQSKCSKGLYRAAIMQSGTSLCLWALTRNASRIAFETGQSLKVDTTNSTTLMKALKKVPYRQLQVISLASGAAVTILNPLAGLLFSPVIEPPHKNAFFSSYSDQILSEGQFNRVPIIIGMNSNEAAVVDDIPALLNLYFLRYDLDYTSLAPADLTNDTLNYNSAAFAVRLHYFGLLPINTQETALLKFVSDDQFNRPTRRTVIQMSKYVPVYFYRFSYKGKLGAGATGFEGVGHGEELGYLFSSPTETNSPSDQLTRSRLVKFWKNFATHRNPTPRSDPLLQNVTWKDAGKDPKRIIFLEIDHDLKLRLNPFEDSMRFYNLIYKKYGSPPYNTY